MRQYLELELQARIESMQEDRRIGTGAQRHGIRQRLRGLVIHRGQP